MSPALRTIKRVLSESGSIFPDMQKVWTKPPKQAKQNWTQQLVANRDKALKSQAPKPKK